MRTVAIIPARFDSGRLPGKAMMPMAGRPMLYRLLERVARSAVVDELVVATTTLDSDDIVASTAEKFGARWFRGSENDVLGRIDAAAKDAKADVVVEIMGDSPLVHADLINDTVALFESEACDFSCSYTNTVRLPHHGNKYSAFPVGIWVEVFYASVMDRCAREFTDAYSREHSTTSIYRHPDTFCLAYLEAVGRWSEARRPDLSLAVNWQRDFDLVSAVFEALLPDYPNFGVVEGIRACDLVREAV